MTENTENTNDVKPKDNRIKTHYLGGAEEITVEDIQNSLRLDDKIDGSLIQRYIDTAEAYVQGAVDYAIPIETYRKYPQFNTAVALFTEYLYQSRGIVSDSPSKKPFEITAMILQLQGIMYDLKSDGTPTVTVD